MTWRKNLINEYDRIDNLEQVECLEKDTERPVPWRIYRTQKRVYQK